jgi:hypothetical protein
MHLHISTLIATGAIMAMVDTNQYEKETGGTFFAKEDQSHFHSDFVSTTKETMAILRPLVGTYNCPILLSHNSKETELESGKTYLVIDNNSLKVVQHEES